MSGVSFPVTRPSGRALLVGNPDSRGEAVAMLGQLGYACDEADDPYAAMAEICHQPGAYVAVILSLTGIYKEELQVIRTIKTRFPQMDVWLAQTDGRHAAMVEGLQLGADGLLAGDGLHRIAVPAAAESGHSAGTVVSLKRNGKVNGEAPAGATNGERQVRGIERGAEIGGEPVLSPEELRALLEDQPFMPPIGE